MLDVRLAAQIAQGTAQIIAETGMHRLIQAKVDHLAPGAGLAGGAGLAVGNEAAAPELAADQAAPFGQGIGPEHGADGDAKIFGERPHGRQLLTGTQQATINIARQRLGDRLIARAAEG